MANRPGPATAAVKQPFPLFGAEPGVRRCRYCLSRRDDDTRACRACGSYHTFRDGLESRFAYRAKDVQASLRRRRENLAAAEALASAAAELASRRAWEAIERARAEALGRVEAASRDLGGADVGRMIRSAFRECGIADRDWSRLLAETAATPDLGLCDERLEADGDHELQDRVLAGL